MKDATFYERYWRKENDVLAPAALPPQWRETDLRRVLDFIGQACSGQGLDVGCGDGFFTNALSRLPGVETVTGADVAQAALNEARKRCPKLSLRLIEKGRLPFSDASFDFVTLIEVAEHILDVEQLFGEVRRVLRPAGRLIVTTTDFNWPKKVLIAALCWEKYFYPTGPHIRFFTRRSLRRFLDTAGFKVTAYRWNGSYLGMMPKGQIVIARKKDGA
ncbi:MAG: class I SAM-dependent methyltransferase [Deltaproteobacteria bacterium]